MNTISRIYALPHHGHIDLNVINRITNCIKRTTLANGKLMFIVYTQKSLRPDSQVMLITVDESIGLMNEGSLRKIHSDLLNAWKTYHDQQDCVRRMVLEKNILVLEEETHANVAESTDSVASLET